MDFLIDYLSRLLASRPSKWVEVLVHLDMQRKGPATASAGTRPLLLPDIISTWNG